MRSDSQLLDLLDRWEELERQGAAPTPEELCRDCPERVADVRQALAGLRRLRPILADGAGASTPVAAADNTAPPEPGPTFAGASYRPLRFHAQGGQGEVYLARDEALGRDVALKRIQPRHGRAEDVERRFLREAEVTARLQHPGVVPVYGVGRDEAGRPFYVMRFVEGESLQDAVRQFHDAPPADAGKRAVAFRQLLARFVALCNVVGYAHAKGVVHRDLKPANVLLGPYGETLVADWGLAKLLDRPEASGDDAGRRGPDEVLTWAGQVVGTPAYMSPEQAAGEDVGPASDVYGLGATLYALLTGEPPFAGHDGRAVLAQVRGGRPEPPRRRNPGVPAALEAVCLKAMAPRPEDRYGSALELAADVERWLADEPVTAYREPRGVRAWRWVRRHRTVMTAAAALLVTATAALAIGFVVVSRERDAKEMARVDAVTARDAESKAHKRTRDALNTLTDDVIEKLFAKQPQLGEDEKKYFREVLRFYEEFAAATGPTTVQARESRADGALRVGIVRSRLSQMKDAEASYRDALARFSELVAEFPADPEYRAQLARTQNNLGSLLAEVGRQKEAIDAFRTALDLHARLTDDFPAVAIYRLRLSGTYTALGRQLFREGQVREAEAAYRTALECQSKLVNDWPADPTYHQNLAVTHGNLAWLYDATDRRRDAEESWRAATALWARLVADHPTVPWYRNGLAWDQKDLGRLLRRTGRPKAAEIEYRKAIDNLSQLTADYPTIPSYASNLAYAYVGFGILQTEMGQVKEAEAAYRSAQPILAKLAGNFPAITDYRSELALAYGSLGALLTDAGRLEEAEAALRQALPLRARLAADSPTVAENQNELAGTLVNLARVANARNEYAKAVQLLEEARPHHEAALTANPGDPSHRSYLRNNLSVLAEALAKQGNHAAAASAAERLGSLGVSPAVDRYNAACALALCVPAAAKTATPTEATRRDLASSYGGRAVAQLREAFANGFKDVSQMLKDPDLAALRSHPDYAALLWDVADGPPSR
jgi:serine/threonine-protein kinase